MSLLKIPLEMFERIAEHADRKDLLSLRLAPREAVARVERTFIISFFSRRTIHTTEQGLQEAIDIAEHSRFGRTLRKITLRIGHQPQDLNFDDDGEFEPTDAITRRHIAKRKLLEELFVTLNDGGKMKSLRIMEGMGDGWPGPYDERYELTCCPSDGNTFLQNVIFQALRRSGLLVEDLDMDFERWVYAHQHRENGADVRSHWSDIFSNLKNLVLEFSPYIEWELEDSLVIQTFEELPQLRELYASDNSSHHYSSGLLWGGELASCIFRTKFQALEQLHLVEGVPKYQELKAFVKRQKTLKKLNLQYSSIYGMLSAHYDDQAPEQLQEQFVAKLAGLSNDMVVLLHEPDFE